MQTNTIKYVLYLSIAFFTICTTYHLLTYVPSLRTSNNLLLVPLIIGAISVFGIGIKSVKKHLRDSETKNVWKNALKGAPKWLKTSLILLVLYVFFNFFFSLIILKGSLDPGIVDGLYVLKNKGKVVREITEEEYFKHIAYTFRAMSGYVLMFVSIAITMLCSAYNLGRKNDPINNN